ncbi:MAG: RNA polymerase factor sigma-54 [Pseudomonadota bacterium]
MVMKPTLALRIGQQLRMTPQLQQAIKLLQLSTFDLQQEIQDALDSNPMLEEVASDDIDGADEPTSLDTPEENLLPNDAATAESEGAGDAASDPEASSNDFDDDVPVANDPEIDGDHVLDTHEQLSSDNISEDLPVDSVWEDVWDDAPLPSSYNDGDESDENYMDTRNSNVASLQTHLEEQLNLFNLTESDELIAMTIIDGLDREGVLTLTIEEIIDSLPAEYEIEADEVEAVLHLIQHLDPVGVAARDLQECLAIQLRSMPEDTPWRAEALEVVTRHLSYLASRDYSLLLRKTRLKEPELKEVISLIRSLNPRPGADFAADDTEYVDPDVIVSKQNGRWVVELNPKSAPRIRVNPEYASLVKRADNSNDNTYLKNHLQEARWFIKSLQQRNDTLLKVATKIVEFQRGFFEYGEQAMKPLVLHDIAKAVELHESTISRVTTQKYMHTPQGVFELKYFFSSHVSTHSGGEVSSTAIRALIKQLVAEENPRKPLSDSKIASLLARQNIKVARRTIAKYREALLIPPSNERKQLV